MSCRPFLITTLGILLCQPAWAEIRAPGVEASVRPGINRAYTNPHIETWMQRFERPGREVYDHRTDIVEATGARPGMMVADIGAGTGLFTWLFSDRVGPDGKVYAVDISGGFIENIEKIAQATGNRNVVAVKNTPRAANLPKGSVDIAFVCDTYHHFEYPASMLASLRDALREDGELVVVDFRKVPGSSSPWVMNHVRADRDAVIAEIEGAGFRLIGENNLLRTNYMLQFVKGQPGH
ncbi:MAG: methyltransferase [Pseudomonadota bacterium]|nr:methyltransferase [Pseudomonadota bacterium]